MLGRELSTVPIHFARLHARQVQPTPDEHALLVEYTSVSAWIAAQSFGDGRFRTVAQVPGYLLTEFGGRRYFVPYGLAGVFPDERQLAGVDGIVDRVRLSARSAFCLSGSSTFTGQVSGISDIDFCEYFIQEPAELDAALSGKSRSADGPQLIAIKRSGAVLLAPFPAIPVGFGSPGGSASWEPLKLDFVANVEPFGAIAATNVVLPIDEGYSRRESLERSFQYQEAVILEDAQTLPGRPLIDPADIGRYLNWLREQAESYAEQSRSNLRADPDSLLHGAYALKSLKRALSWFLMVGLGPHIEGIVDTLRRPEMNAIAAALREDEVRRLLGAVDQGLAQTVRQRFGLKPAPAVPPSLDLKTFFDAALTHAEQLVLDIAVLMRDGRAQEVAA